jgi:hypothetical protein
MIIIHQIRRVKGHFAAASKLNLNLILKPYTTYLRH